MSQAAISQFLGGDEKMGKRWIGLLLSAVLVTGLAAG
jgi:hypothetical protein